MEQRAFRDNHETEEKAAFPVTPRAVLVGAAMVEIGRASCRERV